MGSPAASSTGSAIGLAVLAALAAGGSWWWHGTVFRAPRVEIGGENWDPVKQAYPLPATSGEMPEGSTAALETILQENPFSAERHPASSGGSEAPDGQAEPAQPDKPAFLYKGRINMGQRQRAIMEDPAAKKTYFLEVGQVVATFKVLDITESQVLLSDTESSETVVVPLTSPSTRMPGAGGRGPGQTTRQDEAPREPAREHDRE